MTELRQDLASLRIDREAPARRRPRWPIVLVLAFVIGGAAFFALRDRLAPQGIVVETVRAAIAPVAGPASGTAILSASGYVVPRRKAVVSSKIQGRLADLRVEEGSRVREGEVIARLESADFVAQVQRARATVQRAEADLAENRRLLRLSENLVRDKIVSEDQVDAARSRVTIGEAALEQARADQALSEALFQNTQIRAPFSGTVLKKMAEVGESVAPIPPGVNISSSSGAIVALADLETLEVEADVGESNVAKLGPDQPAEVAVEAFPDRRYKAVLRQIIPTADRTKATVQVKVTILDRDDKLKPEMSARIVFLAKQAAVVASAAPPAPFIMVPEGAVVSRDGASVVFEVEEGRARARTVVAGVARDGQVVVREGLAGAETLIARPPETLRDGDRVRVRH